MLTLTLTVWSQAEGLDWLNKRLVLMRHCTYLGGKFLLWLVGCLGFEPRLAIWVRIQALRWGLHAWGWECGPCPVFASNYALAFTLQLRKITVKPQSGVYLLRVCFQCIPTHVMCHDSLYKAKFILIIRKKLLHTLQEIHQTFVAKTNSWILSKAIMVIILTLEYIKAFFKNGVCIITVLNNEEYTFSVFD